jgi:hypothetical protein
VPASGYKTSGRQASRANALKHGLSARTLVSDESDRLNQLIALLAPECDDKEVWQAAKRAAEAWLYCERVSHARFDLFTAITRYLEPDNRSSGGVYDRKAAMHMRQASDRLVRYERRAIKQLEIALENLQLLAARR